jgi:hypothetical protein
MCKYNKIEYTQHQKQKHCIYNTHNLGSTIRPELSSQKYAGEVTKLWSARRLYQVYSDVYNKQGRQILSSYIFIVRVIKGSCRSCGFEHRLVALVENNVLWYNACV